MWSFLLMPVNRRLQGCVAAAVALRLPCESAVFATRRGGMSAVFGLLKV